MAFRIEFTRKDGTRDSMVFGSKAMAEKASKTLKNPVISEVRVHAPTVYSKPLKEATFSDQLRTEKRYIKKVRQEEHHLELRLEKEPSDADKAQFFADCIRDGIPEWKAEKAWREARQDLSRRSRR